MSNIFDEIIKDIETMNGHDNSEIITALRQKQQELGDDASEEEIKSAIRECLLSQPEEISDDDDDDTSVALSEDDLEYLRNANETVKDFLEENEWKYHSYEIRNDLTVYELGFGLDGINLRVRIHIEAAPNVCRIDAILPVAADPTYEYPLCLLLAQKNYIKRFGSFKYDERDGELSYEYSFLAGHGIYKDELDTYFHAVITSAISEYTEIRKCCVGRFKKKEVNEILKKINDLVGDINE